MALRRRRERLGEGAQGAPGTWRAAGRDSRVGLWVLRPAGTRRGAAQELMLRLVAPAGKRGLRTVPEVTKVRWAPGFNLACARRHWNRPQLAREVLQNGSVAGT